VHKSEAVNPEIAALQQMQDPASIGATLHNQAIILELSRQISTVGGDPLKALDAVPEDSSDTLGVGHPCNDDPCIYSNNRSQFTVSSDEIARYVVRCIATSACGSPLRFASRTPAEGTASQPATITITPTASNTVYGIPSGFYDSVANFAPPNDRPTSTTTPVQSSLGSNNGHADADTSNANSPQTSLYTPRQP
jgi:hypothetical protein